MTKRYDRAYFDRWYRDPENRIGSAADLRRQVHLAVALAEAVLGREVRSVLDVGAGEGRWQPVLGRSRPKARYLGVEPSAWAVRAWGARRHLVRGDFDALHSLGLGGPFDLVIAADVLHYLPGAALDRALLAVAPLVEGLLFAPTFTGGDAISGDQDEFQPRRAATYRRAFAGAGLVQVGPWAWTPRDVAEGLADLELVNGQW